MRLFAPVLSLLGGLAAFSGASFAQAPVETFYKNRNVSIIIGAGVGGSYGMYAQLTARHLGKHIPGRPTFVLQAMPAAAGMAALNYLAAVAPKDGSVITLPVSAIVFETILNEKAEFDAAKFQYIGRLASTDIVGLVSRRAGVKNLEEAIKASISFGAPGPRNGLAIATQLVSRATGGRMKIVTGYQGVADIFLAMERGEVDAISSTIVAPQYLEFMDKRRRNEPADYVPIFAASLDRLPDLPDVPSLTDMNLPEEVQGFMQVFASQGLIGRSLAFPPNAPRAYVEAYRVGFNSMVSDPAFLADAEKLRAPLSPMGGAELQKRIEAIVASTPKDQVGRAKEIYEELVSGVQRPRH